MTDKPRVETGPLMIEDDWPGIFIRGDNAFAAALAIDMAITILKDSQPGRAPLTIAQLEGLRDDLRSCILPMADQSKLQKIWRGEPPQEPPESPGPSDEIAMREPKE